MNLHQSLHKYPTGFAGKTLTLHIGAGFGKVTILQVSSLDGFSAAVIRAASS